MKYVLALILAVFLSACGHTVPAKPQFPVAPPSILEPCETLEQLQTGATLSDVARTVSANYTRYHECNLKHGEFVRWYKLQEKNYNERVP